MSTPKEFLKELTDESVVTFKMLERVPEDKYDWRPHEKSMTMKQLAGHIAELPSWVSMAFNSDELDFQAGTYQPPVINSNQDLLALFNESLAGAKEQLQAATEASLSPTWLLKSGEEVLMSLTKGGLIRHALSQTIHHRAQLGVYLRLLDIPIPGTYGPSADEQSF
ncbi:DinB family protein [Pedobacter sp. MC2016-15]|uniref:DinB family protein n=1 Tax=Pedobacter sp. MC2016-15 TaxID=2994473 RepID=UPI0022454085|nr:DinB family protein [Pedobacter sp. MC2016-15]MCX2477808.1 DinB family protein [Pedobacter sp. MC2016-15]